MFGKMMNSFYYGKSGKGDFRKEDLPKNRWQLFWEMLRVRFSGLCRLNLMAVAAWLPLQLVSLVSRTRSWQPIAHTRAVRAESLRGAGFLTTI